MRITLPSGTQAELIRADAPVRGVVLIPDIGGLRPLFDDLVTDLSRENSWSVIAPEPFPGRESMALDERMNAMAGLDDTTFLADITAAADALDLEPVAVIGFCMGGMYTMKAAATGRFDRAAAFYGMIRVPENWQGPGQRHAIEHLAETPGSAERVLAIIGTADPYTPAPEVDELEAAGAQVVRYRGAEHGFVHDASRASHRADDAADAWARVREWLAV
jgi:carboxymethylenebutenolidase